MSIDFTVGFMVVMAAIFVSFMAGAGVGILLLNLHNEMKQKKSIPSSNMFI